MELKIMYFVHGTTVDNAAGKCSGWKQVELTDLGRERAIKLGEIQKDAGFDVIFTSDLIRAINSARFRCALPFVLRRFITKFHAFLFSPSHYSSFVILF